MLNILCFGDSNTYGFNPKDGSRYKKNERWSGILSEYKDFNVTECGCNNRCAFSNNSNIEELIGTLCLPKYLKGKIFDVVILAVGINDLQTSFNTNLEEFKINFQTLINQIKEFQPNSKILLLCPSKLKKAPLLKSYFANLFNEISIKKSEKLSKIYSEISEENDCLFLDLNKITEVSNIDGLHYLPNEHKKISESIIKILSENF